jgi:autophagy-related protein 101
VGSSTSLTGERGAGDGASARRALQTSLQACVLELLRLVNDRREHIPPVVSSEVVCFPYEITLPSDADGHFGLDMLKRVVLNSNPPPMLA